jgi:hypothetical protein
MTGRRVVPVGRLYRPGRDGLPGPALPVGDRLTCLAAHNKHKAGY